MWDVIIFRGRVTLANLENLCWPASKLMWAARLDTTYLKWTVDSCPWYKRQVVLRLRASRPQNQDNCNVWQDVTRKAATGNLLLDGSVTGSVFKTVSTSRSSASDLQQKMCYKSIVITNWYLYRSYTKQGVQMHMVAFPISRQLVHKKQFHSITLTIFTEKA